MFDGRVGGLDRMLVSVAIPRVNANCLRLLDFNGRGGANQAFSMPIFRSNRGIRRPNHALNPGREIERTPHQNENHPLD